ncbi:MAG: Flp pilus assembly protein CpaB [Terracidiphilus sp.]|jgi:pilus assembly protein CpaB
MNRRLLTILVIAFVIAGLCAFMVARMLGSRLQATKPAATRYVVAANADIKLGTILAPGNLTSVQIVGDLPEGAILKPEDAINRGVISDLYKGEPILESRLAAKDAGGGLAAAIPLGFRACAIRVDEVVGVSGFVTPGMRVDVLISGNPPGQQSGEQGTQSRTLLQNIRVLSAGTDIQKDQEGKAKQVQVVNVLVTPEQAESLTLAQNQGVKIQLVLRNPLDTTTDPVPGTGMGLIFADKTAAKPKSVVVAKSSKKPASEAFSIEVINGSSRSKQEFGSPEVKP